MIKVNRRQRKCVGRDRDEKKTKASKVRTTSSISLGSCEAGRGKLLVHYSSQRERCTAHTQNSKGEGY